MWELEFISRDDLKHHIHETIMTYGHTLDSKSLLDFNKNIVDPIKLAFDSRVYKKSIDSVISDELMRQRDKSNNNAIGYFHQNLFSYLDSCEVPKKGFDVIFTRSDGSRVFVEMKNKHNTMNSSSSQKTYMKMMDQLLNEKDCYCYLVEIIAKRSQNRVWDVSVDGKRISNDRIRRVSIDRFLEEVTGDSLAFYKICEQLPILIDETISENADLTIKNDTVIDELKAINSDILFSLYSIAFNSYLGFSQDFNRLITKLDNDQL